MRPLCCPTCGSIYWFKKFPVKTQRRWLFRKPRFIMCPDTAFHTDERVDRRPKP